MSLKFLENSGLIKKLTIDPKYVNNQMNISNASIVRSKSIFDEDHEDAFKKAYDGALAAGRALMGSQGYRPSGEHQHYSVERFLEHYLDPKLVRKFHDMRNKRNISQYEQIGNISIIEAQNAIVDSEQIIEEIKVKLKNDGF